jgi:TrmH family RNA methyltransferase
LLTPAQLSRLRVVLCSTRNPLNIGAAARAMTNFGFRELRIVTPYAPAFREARSAVGASHLLANAKQYDTVAEAVADGTLVVGTTAVRKRQLQHSLRRLEDGARLIRKRLSAGPVALLFGSEKFGLTNEELSHANWLIRIPTVEANISMNLGQAVAICLYELIRDPKAARLVEKAQSPSAAEIDRVTSMLLEALSLSGFLGRRHVADSKQRIRRLVRRLGIPARDSTIWLGMLRQILWKLNSDSNNVLGARD